MVPIDRVPHAGAMTTTPPPSSADSSSPSPVEDTTDSSSEASTPGGPRVTRDEVRDLSRLRRTTGDRKVAGVAGGLARHLDVDPLILRVGFVVLAFFGGAGLILYAAGWALVPEEDRERAPVHLDERSRTIALVALGVIAALALVGDSWGAFWFPWPLAIIGLIAFVWLSRSRDRAERRAGPVAQNATSAPTPYIAPLPRDPRKRGPKLFWFTLLLIAFSEGVLGILDAAGAPVVDSAYPALALGVIATMLIIGSVMGRAGGLMPIGVVAFAIVAATTAADRWDGERYEYTPSTSDEVSDIYTVGTGDLIVDLTEVADLDGLDGRTIELTGSAAAIEVVVPRGLDVEVDITIDGPGRLRPLRPRRRRLLEPDRPLPRRRHRRPLAHPRRRAVLRRDHDRHGVITMSNHDDTATVPTDDDRPGYVSWRHPVNVGHLVMGVAFAGMILVWALIVGNVVDDDDVRWLMPIPWVSAGGAGLVAMTLAARRRR